MNLDVACGSKAIELRNSDRLPKPQGSSHASVAPPGRIVHLAGQIGTDAEGNLAEGLAAQTDQALANFVDALNGAGCVHDDLAKMTICIVGWTEALQPALFKGLGAAAKRTRLPQVPLTLIGVQSLFVDAALVEVEGVAVLPA